MVYRKLFFCTVKGGICTGGGGIASFVWPIRPIKHDILLRKLSCPTPRQIPMIHEALKRQNLNLFISPWSPPEWMKVSHTKCKILSTIQHFRVLHHHLKRRISITRGGSRRFRLLPPPPPLAVMINRVHPLLSVLPLLLLGAAIDINAVRRIAQPKVLQQKQGC